MTDRTAKHPTGKLPRDERGRLILADHPRVGAIARELLTKPTRPGVYVLKTKGKKPKKVVPMATVPPGKPKQMPGSVLKTSALGLDIVTSLVNKRAKSERLTRARVMSVATGPCHGFEGWLNGELDSPREGERVHQVTLTIWVYKARADKKGSRR